MKKLQLFDQNHGLSPLQICQFCLFFKSMFILFRKACFLRRTSPNTFSRRILIKRNVNKISNFWPKPRTNPFGKMPILWVFVGVTRGYRRLKGVTRGDRGLQGVTLGYKRWQGVTRVTVGYKGWKGVTRGYRGLQGVTGGYKGLQTVTKDYGNFF